MNEQALQDAYNLFVQQGYKKSIDDFKTLISTNQDALNDSYNLFASQGYNKSVNDYKALIGIGAPAAAPKAEAPLKKKGPTALPSEDSFLASQSQLPSFETTPLKDITREQAVATAKAEKKKFVPATTDDDLEGQQSYWSNLGTKALSGVTSLDKMVASLPETAIDLISIPQNLIAAATGWDIAGSSQSFKKQFGISNPILDKLNEEEKRLQEKSAAFNKDRYESLGIVDNISKGNYQDAFELLGSNIVESAPVSIAMMMGGATLSPMALARAGTAGFFQQNKEQLDEENPNMSEIEKTVKALGMAASETVFESVGTGTLGKVYKDIITKEGAEAGTQIFRDGLVQMYKGALKKYGAPIGLIGEGVEEAATQITQNVISGKPAFEGAADAFVTGAGSGVVFSAPINAIKAKQYVSNTIDTYKSKNKIADVLRDTDTNLDQVYNVPKDAAITPQQLEIANTNKSRDILSKDLSNKVKSGEISEADAKQSLYVFDKVQQVSNSVKDLDVDADTKASIATLLRKRVELSTKIQNMDDALVIKEKQEIANINKQIEDIVLNAKPAEVTTETGLTPEQRDTRITEIETKLSPEGGVVLGTPEWDKLYNELKTLRKEKDAIQEQATNESVLRTEQPEVGLQQMVEGDQKPEVVTAGTEETITPEGTQEIENVFLKEGRYTVKKDDNNFSFYHKLETDNTELDNNAVTEFPETKTPFKFYRTDDINAAKSEMSDGNRPNGSKGIYFSLDKNYSNMYGKSGAKEYYLDIKNPKIITSDSSEFDFQNLNKKDIEKLKAQGYDGVVVHFPKTTVKIDGINYDGEQELYKEVIAFDKNQIKEVSSKTQPSQQTEEAKLEIEEEKFVPMETSEVKTARFTKNDALDYIEDEKETESGRIVPYVSSMTVEATNADGDPLGTITKVTDEDNIFYFTAEDVEGNMVGTEDGFETLGDAKKAIADAYNKTQKKEFEKAAKKKAKQKEKVAAKKAKTEEKIAGLMDDLLALDPEDKTTAQKIQSGLDKLIKDIEKFEKENLGVNIALPVIKTILKAIKVLVDAGVSLEQAIKQAAKDNNVAVRDVVDGINAVNKIAPIQAEYDALMTKADELIARQKTRGIDETKIVSNLDTMIRNSEVYKNADDAQKKIMEREARNKMGVKPKIAVSIGRVLGALKDITAISREEKMNVIKQIRDLSRDAAKDLANEIREMASKGSITTRQAANVIARFGKVNMLNEISVSNFVDYMAKVFANAEYANKIDVAKSKLKAAKKNIATKIGIADGLMLPLQRLFSINPTLIPDQYLERYLELVDMFGARQAVLTLEQKQDVTKDVQAILDEIDNERSKADELADRLNSSENKVYEDDKLDYAASVKKMLDEKEIDEKEAETMRKYKEDIAPQVEETELTDEEAEQEKKELIDAVNKSIVDSSELPTKDERELAKELARLIKTDALDGLTNTELKNLLKVIDNINNNYLPHYTQLMVEKMNSINNGKALSSAIQNAKPAKLSTIYSKVKAFVARTGRTGISELIRRNPLYYIDQLFGDYKTKDIFNSILGKAADAEALFKADLKKVQNILENAEEKVAKSFKLDANKTLMSKFKMMTYMIQLEYESNKGSKQVNSAADYLKATIKHIDAGKSEFGDRDAEMLQEILDNYIDADGNIDNEKLYKSFNQAEKDAIKDIREVNESLADKAQYTAAIIRGQRITPLNNYIHLNVLHEHQPNDLTTGTAFVDEYNNSMRPSTKAKSLIARTGKVSPLNFDVFASAQRGAKFVLMDYNLTEPIRTARKTLNQAIANLEKNGRVPKEKRQIFNAINSAFEETVENLLTNAYVSDTIVDEAINYINKQGYRAILAGTGRFVSELSSNIGFAMLADPKGFIEGVKNKGFIMSVDAPLVMENVKSKQTTRIFPTDTLAGKLIDTSILSQASGIKGAKSKNPVANKIQQIYNLTGKKYVNSVELVADSLISTPDKMVMRPMWFGAFSNEFKDITGKDVDFEKIAANDEEYMSDNKDAIEKAKDLADQRSVMAGATDNPFMGVLKGTVKPNQSLLLRGFNNFNNFMTRFLIFEYVTARTAINAAIGNGSLSKKQGAATLAAVATRMMVYTLMTQALGTGLIGLVFGGDDEPETEKTWLQKVGQGIASMLTSLTIGRDFGNATKSLLNYGVERVNENYLDFLREGDYDPYKDALQYSIVPPEKKGKQTDLKDFLLNMGGSFGPAAKTLDLTIRKAFEPEKKQEAAIERQKKEIGIRIPLEILGNAGLIPLYKDVRKEVMKSIYKDLEVAQENADNKAEVKREKLQGYENEGDMKRYDPELWDRTFGKDAPDYDVRQAEKALKKAQDSVERAMKDEMYNYIPRKKSAGGGLKKLY